MICVAMLQAVEKECGFSMSVPEMTVPFPGSMSSRIDEVAVVHMLGIVIRIVEVDDTGLMRLDDVARAAGCGA